MRTFFRSSLCGAALALLALGAGAQEAHVIKFGHLNNTDNVHTTHWFVRIAKDPAFQRALKRRWDQKQGVFKAAGADMILVHSRQRTPAEVMGFVAAWDGAAPLVLVPTAYPQLTEAAMRETGRIGVVIYGNHAIRAAVTAMQQVFRQIRAEGGIAGADAAIVSVEEIFRLQGVPAMKAAEARYLR